MNKTDLLFALLLYAGSFLPGFRAFSQEKNCKNTACAIVRDENKMKGNSAMSNLPKTEMKTGYYRPGEKSAYQYHLYIPETYSASKPKILLIHGGGWSSMKLTTMTQTALMLAKAGYIVCNIEYTLTGEAPWPACGDDCLEAAKKLIRNELPGLNANLTEKIFVIGGSAGGHLALMTGLRLPRKNIAGIVSFSGVANPDDDVILHPKRYKALMPGGMDPRAFPEAYLDPKEPPILLTHCVSDDCVPIISAKKFKQHAEAKGITNIETYFYDFGRKGEGHAIWQREFLPRERHLYTDISEKIVEFFAKYAAQPEK